MYQPTPKKLCSRCGSTLPLDKFRRVYKDQEKRHCECNVCYRESYRRRQLIKRQRFSGRTLNAISNARTLEEAERLIRALLNTFGGLQGFVTAWHRWFTDPQMPNSYRAKSLLAMFRLTQLTSQERDRLTPTVDQMTDDQLSMQKAQFEERVLRNLVESGRLEQMLQRIRESN